MAIALGPGATGDKLAAKQDVGTDVTYEVNGDLRTIAGSTDAYGSLAQGALSTTETALVGPAAGTDIIVDSISLANTGASTRVVTFYKTKNSTTYTTATKWGPAITLLTGESAEWNGAWTIYSSLGFAKTAQTSASNMLVTNVSIADQVGFAADAYLDGSSLLLPTSLIRAKTAMYWVFDAVKTAACTGTPTVIIRFGTGGNIGDTARLTFTFSAQTAAIDRATFEVWANFRAVGSGTSGVITGIAKLKHQLATTGFNSTTTGMQTLAVTSGGFDSTVANSYVGLSVNGTSTTAPAVWTVSVVQAIAYM